MEELQLKRCINRIKQCGHELIELEEDLITDDCGLQDMIRNDLRVKTTLLYLDFNKVITYAIDHDHKMKLTRLGNALFQYMEQLALAVKKQKVSEMQTLYKNINDALRELTVGLSPLRK